MIDRVRLLQAIRSLPARVPAMLPLGLATLCGGLAYWGATGLLQAEVRRAEQRLAQRYAPREVLVASRDLPGGTVLESTMLARRIVPDRFVAHSALHPADLTRVTGTRLAVALEAGDPIRPAVIAPKTPATLSAMLPVGRRAVTIQVDDTRSQAGLIMPGDRIDVLQATDRIGNGERTTHVEILLESVLVLATGRSADGARRLSEHPGLVGDAFDTLTIEVSPDQARRVAMAERDGELLVTLRASGDLGLTVPEYRVPAARRSARMITAHVDGWIGGRGQGQLEHRWPVVQP